MRTRSHDRDPYDAFRASDPPRWRLGAALAVPLVGVLVLVLNFAVGASGSAAPAGTTARASLASLLLADTGPTPGATTTLSPVGQQHQAPAAKQQTSQKSSTTTNADGVISRQAPRRDAVLVPYSTMVVHLNKSVPGYPTADAIEANRTVPGSWYGYPSSLPVVAKSDGRLKVRLAQRPDETETWIDRGNNVLTVTHYAIVVDIAQHWLYVFHYGQQVGNYPVGTGAAGTPTPTGTYFLAFHAPPNGPGYGSVMLETSAHSRVIEHFEGGNDAIIAIHGPVGSDAEIGDHGAAISNGCIRMHDWDLRKVAHVVNGAPIILTD